MSFCWMHVTVLSSPYIHTSTQCISFLAILHHFGLQQCAWIALRVVADFAPHILTVQTNIIIKTMKTTAALLLSLIASAAAFAPNSQSNVSFSHPALLSDAGGRPFAKEEDMQNSWIATFFLAGYDQKRNMFLQLAIFVYWLDILTYLLTLFFSYNITAKDCP